MTGRFLELVLPRPQRLIFFLQDGMMFLFRIPRLPRGVASGGRKFSGLEGGRELAAADFVKVQASLGVRQAPSISWNLLLRDDALLSNPE